VPNQCPPPQTDDATPPRFDAEQAETLITAIRHNIERALRGKPEVVRRAVETLLAGGHLLLEDVPGVGKTTLAQALARSIDGSFSRVQFTSDLLPSDVLGASIPEARDGVPTGEFVFQPGPIFANVVLADEVNRASPKTQSALLEAMAESGVTVDGVTHPLPEPYFVVATQNPMEHHGAHPLPESQLDRFLVRTGIGYPNPTDEAAVLREDPAATELPRLQPVVTIGELRELQRAAEAIKFDEALVGYLLAITGACARGRPRLLHSRRRERSCGRRVRPSHHRRPALPPLPRRRGNRVDRPRNSRSPAHSGWLFFAITLGVGFAALNTGNNLMYLVLSLMLGFLLLSGVLSESSLRGIRVRRRLPRELYANFENKIVLEISNTQRRVAAFATPPIGPARSRCGSARERHCAAPTASGQTAGVASNSKNFEYLHVFPSGFSRSP